jgi:hypothetical protein
MKNPSIPPCGPVIGAQADGPRFGDPFGRQARQVGGFHRQPGVALQGRFQLCLAFLGQQRAGAEHQPPAGFQQVQRAVDQLRLQVGQRGRSDPSLTKGRSGWRRIVPVAEQGASSSTASKGRGRPSAAHRPPRSRPSARCAPGSRATAPARAGDVERRDRRPGGRHLQRLAARGCAQVQHPLARPDASRRAGRAAAASCTHQCPSA